MTRPTGTARRSSSPTTSTAATTTTSAARRGLPDDIPPLLGPDDLPGAYDRYGFRVPLSWSRRGPASYVSNVVQDHTTILRFIERKWNLGA